MTDLKALSDRELGERIFADLLGYRRDERRPDQWWCNGAQHYDCDIRPNHHPDEVLTGDGMLLVLEAMRERGWEWVTQSGDGGWAIAVQHHDGRSSGEMWDGNPTPYPDASLPRAVAEAALEALNASRSMEGA